MKSNKTQNLPSNFGVAEMAPGRKKFWNFFFRRQYLKICKFIFSKKIILWLIEGGEPYDQDIDSPNFWISYIYEFPTNPFIFPGVAFSLFSEGIFVRYFWQFRLVFIFDTKFYRFLFFIYSIFKLSLR